MKNCVTEFFFAVAWSNHLWVLKYVEVFMIDLFKILEDICQLSGVVLYEFTVNKARTLIEQVIKRLNIEQVADLARVVLFNFIFYYKSHVAEWESQVFFENQPVVVFSIESVSLFNI